MPFINAESNDAIADIPKEYLYMFANLAPFFLGAVKATVVLNCTNADGSPTENVKMTLQAVAGLAVLQTMANVGLITGDEVVLAINQGFVLVPAGIAATIAGKLAGLWHPPEQQYIMKRWVQRHMVNRNNFLLIGFF